MWCGIANDEECVISAAAVENIEKRLIYNEADVCRVTYRGSGLLRSPSRSCRFLSNLLDVYDTSIAHWSAGINLVEKCVDYCALQTTKYLIRV